MQFDMTYDEMKRWRTAASKMAFESDTDGSAAKVGKFYAIIRDMREMMDLMDYQVKIKRIVIEYPDDMKDTITEILKYVVKEK